MRACTEIFAATLAGLDDAAFGEPSRLPGWTRAHVVAHVHFNALALTRLAGWAETGVESLMYDGPDQRSAEIDGGAALPPSRLRELVGVSGVALERSLDRLDDAGWARQVVTARGRAVPAAQIPWLRTREVAVHSVDLAGATDFEDLPDAVLGELSTEAVALHGAAGAAPALAAWLTGRSDRAPALGAWL